MSSYIERLHQAQAQLDGIEHDKAAGMARAMWAAKQIGYCHIYDPAERIDYIWNESGTTWEVQRGDAVMQQWFIEAMRYQVSYLIANA